MEDLADRSRTESGSQPEVATAEPDARPGSELASAAEPGAPRWRYFLAGSPREVLARIVQDDPLGVRERVALRLREQAWLLDADRVHLRALARCARFAARYHGRPELMSWIDGQVEAAAEDLLLEEFEAERNGDPPVAEHAAAFVALARPLGLEPESMRRACVLFNRLPPEERRAFFDLVILGRPLDDLARENEGGATEIARRARRALDAILHTQLASETRPGEPKEHIR